MFDTPLNNIFGFGIGNVRDIFGSQLEQAIASEQAQFNASVLASVNLFQNEVSEMVGSMQTQFGRMSSDLSHGLMTSAASFAKDVEAAAMNWMGDVLEEPEGVGGIMTQIFRIFGF